MKPVNRSKASFLAVALCCVSAGAQVGTFSYAYKKDGQGEVEKDFSRSYKLAVVSRVYDALIEARGNFSLMRPQLQMSASENQVAYLDPVAKTIVLEEKAYDICTGFGADSLNALAALLSHELMHYYQRHSLTGTAGNESNVVQEVEADYLGGFLAHLAGYNTLPMLPELLKKLYQTYPLQEDMPGYPSLAQRVDLTVRASLRFDALLYRFKLANLLTVSGHYEDAVVYYKIMADSFPSREIYNNLGVLYTLWELQKSPETLDIMLPLELDPVSRLEHRKRVPLPAEYAGSQLLQTALSYFRQASVLDSRYLPALINEACVLALTGNTESAEETAAKAQKLAKKQNKKEALATVFTVQGVIAYLGATAEGDAAAAQHWEAAVQMGSATGGYNLSVLRKTGSSPPVGPVEKYDPSKIEMIEERNLDWNITRFQDDLNVFFLPEPWQEWRFGLMREPLKESTILLHYKDYSHYFLYQFTDKGFSGTTAAGIRCGNKPEEVEMRYGQPSVKMNTPGGQYWFYAKSRIIFEIGGDVVKGWVVFHA